jgi:hypothetical protein
LAEHHSFSADGDGRDRGVAVAKDDGVGLLRNDCAIDVDGPRLGVVEDGAARPDTKCLQIGARIDSELVGVRRIAGEGVNGVGARLDAGRRSDPEGGHDRLSMIE